MRRRVWTPAVDHVYIDLAFGIPAPPRPGDQRTVGIGLMDYSGNNEDDRSQAGEIHSAYIEKMTSFSGGWSITAAGCGCSSGTPTTPMRPWSRRS